jgi:uncharacterized membrane protein YphA (DoxX/SURF4 family)
MITFTGFVVGLLLIGLGFLMVWKTRRWQEYVGSLNIILGYPRSDWLDWNTLGIGLMALGLLLVLGLLQSFFALTVGSLFRLGGLR